MTESDDQSEDVFEVDENPFQSPASDQAAFQFVDKRRPDLKDIALFQKGILVCILLYVVALCGQIVLPSQLKAAAALALPLIILAGAVFTVLLAVKLYGVVQGILIGLVSLVPCIGLLALLLINGKATKLLKANGVKVGFLGANLSQF